LTIAIPDAAQLSQKSREAGKRPLTFRSGIMLRRGIPLRPLRGNYQTREVKIGSLQSIKKIFLIPSPNPV
jgi:hypothetical protein